MNIVYLAYRHGLSDSDIHHAWRHALAFYDIATEFENREFTAEELMKIAATRRSTPAAPLGQPPAT